jgi:hypothetical protein
MDGAQLGCWRERRSVSDECCLVMALPLGAIAARK